MQKLDELVINLKKQEKNYEIDKILNEIISECENTIKYFCLKYKNIPLDFEDIRAELLIELYNCLESFDPDGVAEFKTYLSACLENKCNKLYRDLTRQKRVLKDEDGEIVHDLSFEDLVENSNEVTEIEGSYSDYSEVEVKIFLDSLDLAPTERLICEEFSKGLRPSEVGEKLGISPSMITYKVKKIRYKVQLSLNL